MLRLNEGRMSSDTKRSRTPFGLISETGALQRIDIPKGHAIAHIAQQMAVIHSTILRALNSSYNQCLAVKAGSSDAEGFLFYNQCIFKTLHGHHAHEEEGLFQELENLVGIPGLMNHNVEQHKAFEAGVERFRGYVYNTTMKYYDGNQLKLLISGFGSVVTQHLHDEIPSLLDLKTMDSTELLKIWKRGERAARGRVNPYRYIHVVVEVKIVY